MSAGVPTPSPALGRLLAFNAATSFGLITTCARLAYDGGSDPITVVAFRCMVAIVAAVAVIAAFHKPMRLPREALLPALGATIGQAGMSICYLSSVAFIPVSLAALIFYTHPLMVAVAARRIGGAANIPHFAVFLVAFAGLFLALGPSFGNLDWHGVALALTAALFTTMLYVCGASAMRHVGSIPLAFVANVGSLPFFIVAVLMVGGPAIPETASAWSGFAGTGVFFAIAIISQFAAIRFGGAATTALLLNLEPLISITAAALLLGERLSGGQYAGVFLVLVALMVAGRTRGRTRTRPGS